jgi:hypothetical protein
MRLVLGLAVRPRLWSTALAQGVRLAPRRWWARFPFLPLPAGEYLAFRLATQYGGGRERAPEMSDVIDYLEWCRDWHSTAGRRRVR